MRYGNTRVKAILSGATARTRKISVRTRAYSATECPIIFDKTTSKENVTGYDASAYLLNGGTR